MRFNRISAYIIAAAILASPNLRAQEKATDNAKAQDQAKAQDKDKEQATFSADDNAVKNPVPLPEDVLFLLKNDSFAADAFHESDPTSCFSASTIRLGPRVDDLIVEAEGTLRGTNVNMFWVFLTTPSGHRLVLKTPAHVLIVEHAHTKGYRDITIRSGTPLSDNMRFNGKHYALWHETKDAGH